MGTNEVIDLGLTDLLLAATLVIIAGITNLMLRLRLTKTLTIAAIRTVAQLLLIGYVLREVFRLQAVWAIAGMVLVMIVAASHAAIRRSSRTFAEAGILAFGTLVVTGLVTAYLVTGIIIDVPRWYDPQYLIPLLGMVLGNSLTGISLCLDDLLASLTERRAMVEMELAHGANRWEAATTPLRNAVRRGMIPIINSMMVVGLVSLPGMMTGQILAGTDPLQAVKYQIVVMFMIAAATSLGCMGIAHLACWRLFNDKHQLLANRIHKRRVEK